MSRFKGWIVVLAIGLTAWTFQTAGAGERAPAEKARINFPVLVWDVDYPLLNRPIPAEVRKIFSILPYQDGVWYLLSISGSCPACGRLACAAIEWKRAKLKSVLKDVVLLIRDDGSSGEREIEELLPPEAVYLNDQRQEVSKGLFIEGTPELVVIDKGTIVGLLRGSDQITAFFNALYE